MQHSCEQSAERTARIAYSERSYGVQACLAEGTLLGPRADRRGLLRPWAMAGCLALARVLSCHTCLLTRRPPRSPCTASLSSTTSSGTAFRRACSGIRAPMAPETSSYVASATSSRCRALPQRAAAATEVSTSPRGLAIDTAPVRVAGHRIRRTYDHERDFEAVKDLCKNVYGGKDYLPALLEETFGTDADSPTHDAADNIVYLVVTCPEGETLDAIIGIERQGLAALWLFALRVREEARGQGLGKLMMVQCDDIADDLAASGALSTAAEDRAVGVLSATIEPNTAMMRIFLDWQGYRVMARNHVWPRWDVTAAQDQANGGDRLAWRESGPTLDFTGQREAVTAAASSVEASHEWARVTDGGALVTALEELQGRAGSLRCWIPAEYVIYGVGSDRVAGFVRGDEVCGAWLLRDRSTGRVEATAVLRRSFEMKGRVIVGVVARSEAGVASALLLADRIAPRFCAVVDVGTTQGWLAGKAGPMREPEPWPEATSTGGADVEESSRPKGLELLEQIGGSDFYVVVERRCAARGA
ncbi:unnamed protein product [Pedinophyceae sp. YPF-701]|nr:unnamed protein product [Pedinophyceae sp. YPF-701]